jgi:hypothetical protein
MEGFMRSIPTFAVMSAIDPEWVAAKERLAAFLEETGLAPDGDGAAEAPENVLTYLCSIPRRQDNGAIHYVHLFQHDDRFMTKPAYFHVAASPGWWPDGCRSLPPQRRTGGRALLRLVS